MNNFNHIPQIQEGSNAAALKKYQQENTLSSDTLILSEHPFYTVQGEGYYTGTPTIFVRTAFCNIRCNFCDTVGVWDVNKFRYTFSNLLVRMQDIAPECNRIVLTGGEPMLQLSLEFIQFFQENDYKINIETNGIVHKNFMRYLDYICISPKRLSDQVGKESLKGTDQDKYLYSIEAIAKANEIKFIIDEDTDEKLLFKFINDTQGKRGLFSQIYLSPMDLYNTEDNKKSYEKLTKLVLSNPNLFKISLQTHKFLNLP